MSAQKPTDTDFSAYVTKLREASCDVVARGRIVRETAIIISTIKKPGWNIDLPGQAAWHGTANHYGSGPNQRHDSTKAFLAVIRNGRWVPVEQQALVSRQSGDAPLPPWRCPGRRYGGLRHFT